MFTFLLVLAATVAPQSRAATQLVSTHNPLVARPAGGNGDSVAPVLTPDGRFVLFTSLANDLTANGNNLFSSELFLRDCLSNTTTLVSVNTNGIGGGNTNLPGAMVSTNGRFVVFASDAPDLVAGDTNKTTDVFLRDLLAGTTTLVSVSTNGGVGSSSSTAPFMTPDGRYVAFVSAATNLVANYTNGVPGVFVRDTQAGTTVCATPSVNGPGSVGVTVMGTPVITPDGRFVAFFSTDPGLPTNGALNTNGEIFLCDLMTTNITWVSSNAAALAGFGPLPSTHPVMSDDGRYIAFKYGSTNGPNLAATNLGASFIFQYDTLAGTLTLVNSNAFPPASSADDICGPEMTPDGRYIVFSEQTVVSNLPYSSVHVWDRLGAPDTLVSADTNGGFPTSTFSDSAVISADGRRVAFVSTANSLVTNPVDSGAHVYVRDLLTAQTQLVDVDTNGAGSSDVSGTVPAISSDGRYVSFASLDGQLVAGDFNNKRDVFVRDTTNGMTQMVSVRSPMVNDQSGDGYSSAFPALSMTPTGRYVVYASRADDLVTNDFNNNQDIFEADLSTGSNALVSVGLDGNAALGGDSYDAVVSADGRYVAFLSAATNLVVTPLTYLNYNLFVRDMQTGVTALVNVDTNGVPLGNGDCFTPTISQDGRYVSFYCQENVSVAATNLIWRDTWSNLTETFPTALQSFFISVDGRYVAYSYITNSAVIRVIWDSTVLSNVYNQASSWLSPSGAKFLVQGGTILYATNWQTRSNLGQLLQLFPSTNSGPFTWSADENSIAFLANSQLAGLNQFAGVLTPNRELVAYLWDLNAGAVALVSSNYASGGYPSAGADSLKLSGDGRSVAYRSFATDITPGITSVPNIFWYNRGFGSNNYQAYAGSNVLVTSEPPGSSWNPYTFTPAISGDGRIAAFTSMRSGLGPTDLAHEMNIFAATLNPWGSTDSVGDGIPDEWRANYFGGDGTTTNSQSCATCDPDGDGMSNAQEFLAGTDPTNPNSALLVRVYPAVSGNSVVLQWAASPGVSYSVQYKDSLESPGWTVASGTVTLVGLQASITVSGGAAGRFYRVVAN